MSDLIVQLYNRNKSLNNIDIYDQPSRMHLSPPRSRQNFQIRKIQRFDKSHTEFLDLMIECFDQDKSCQKCHFKQY